MVRWYMRLLGVLMLGWYVRQNGHVRAPNWTCTCAKMAMYVRRNGHVRAPHCMVTVYVWFACSGMMWYVLLCDSIMPWYVLLVCSS